jgi:hypothetical protein
MGDLQLLSGQVDRQLQTASLLGPVSGVGSDGAGSQGPNRPHIFFVDPTTGATSGDGQDPRRPLSTIQAAIDNCEANRGDIIVVARGGHVVTESINCNKRGITIIADSYGVNRRITDEHWIIANASYTSGPVVEITAGCRWIGFTFASRFTTGPSVRTTVDGGTGASGNYVEMVECNFPGWGLGFDGFEIRGANFCALRRCHFFDIANSGAGISFRGSGTNNPVKNEIEDCVFHNVTAGIKVTNGTPQDNFIHKCRFKDCTDDINTNGGAGDMFVTENWHEGSAANAHDDSVTNLVGLGWTFAGNHYGES